MTVKKMFVFDYDGTFYRNHTELLENIKLIEKVRTLGHLFVIATGRSYDSFIKEVNKFNIKFDFLILSSGALIIDSNETVIKTYPMDLDLVIGSDRQLEQFQFRLHDKIFIDCFQNNKVISNLNQVIKMSYTFEKSEDSYKIQSLINEYTDHAFKTYVVRGKSVDYIEVIASKTNKSVAILDLLDFLSVDYDIVTAGDSENDAEMLIAFDGYLMAEHDVKLDVLKLRTIDSINSILCKELHIEDPS
jgi:HAD superfamily hydrolase (TIGR01484 family)